MPRPKSDRPSYCHHARSGNAYVTIDGREHWLGRFNSPESRDKYDRLIGAWLLNGRADPTPAAAAIAQEQAAGITISGVLAAFLDHARTYYVQPAYHRDGKPKLSAAGQPILESSGEFQNFIDACKSLRRLYGPTAAAEFGPLALKVVREDLIVQNLCRNVINRRTKRIKQIFRWAVENELVPAGAGSKYHALAEVQALRKGKSAARETEPIRPVSDHHVAAVLPFLPPNVTAMVQLQRLTGMRSGEMFIMRTSDVDMTGEVWSYRPSTHKTAHHDQDRVIPIGPKARAILEPWLRPDLAAFIWSPTDATRHMRDQRYAARQTDAGKGNVIGSNRQRSPRRSPRLRYFKDAYKTAILRACDRAFPPPAELARARVLTGKTRARWETIAEWKLRLGVNWPKLRRWQKEHRFHPHQLRHAAATEIRREFGLEAAQHVLGHSKSSTTELYAERDQAAAARVAAAIG